MMFKYSDVYDFYVTSLCQTFGIYLLGIFEVADVLHLNSCIKLWLMLTLS